MPTWLEVTSASLPAAQHHDSPALQRQRAKPRQSYCAVWSLVVTKAFVQSSGHHSEDSSPLQRPNDYLGERSACSLDEGLRRPLDEVCETHTQSIVVWKLAVTRALLG